MAAAIFSLTIRSASRVASLPPVIIRKLRSQITADISAPSTHPSIASSGQVFAEDFVDVLVMEDTPATRCCTATTAGGVEGCERGPQETIRQTNPANIAVMETVNFLLDRPLALLVVLLVGALIGIGFERAMAKADAEKRKAYWRGRNSHKFGKKGPQLKTVEAAERKEAGDADFAAEQLKTVSRAPFTSRSLLNKSEAKVFDALDKAVIARNSGWQVMAQVSLGEFLASPDKDAFFAINSKRVDFALMDEKCRVVHALEYQGSGHHHGNSAAARDAVKKEALRKAGIGYHEIVAGHTTPSELRALVEKLVPAG